jgi:hypothetical protein
MNTQVFAGTAGLEVDHGRCKDVVGAEQLNSLSDGGIGRERDALATCSHPV